MSILDRELDLLKQIERVKRKLRRSVQRKLQYCSNKGIKKKKLKVIKELVQKEGGKSQCFMEIFRETVPMSYQEKQSYLLAKGQPT